MSVEHVEFLVEEPSMEAALRQLLPKLMGNATFDIYQFQGKTDLLQQLPSRLKGYSSWLPDSWRIVVVVDRDDDDCKNLKQRLEQAALSANLATHTSSKRNCRVINHIAIEELEAWYFGDWQAVRSAYPRVTANITKQAKYRSPDEVKGGTWEALLRIMQSAGYFKTGLRKIEAARAIGMHLDPKRNTSPSFRKLVHSLNELLQS